MPSTLPPKVQTFLQDLEMTNGDHFAVVSQLLKLCEQVYPDSATDIKYGGIIIILDDKHVGGVFNYRDHVTMEFSNGYLLEDPSNLLEGTGQFRRNLKFHNLDDIVSKDAIYFIKQLKN